MSGAALFTHATLLAVTVMHEQNRPPVPSLQQEIFFRIKQGCPIISDFCSKQF